MSKYFFRRAFSTQSTSTLPIQFFLLVHPKFPEGTIAGTYKSAVARNELIDAVRFDAQRFNWNLREIDVLTTS